MEKITNIASGNRSISADLEIAGIYTGNIEVTEGATLVVNGILNGSVRVQAGGVLHHNGIATGHFTNHGGQVVIKGILNGSLTTLSGSSEVSRTAAINE